MFTTIKTAYTFFMSALPFILCLTIGGYLVYDNMSTKADLSKAEWDLATMTNRAESAEYNLQQEHKWQEERRQWNTALDVEIRKFKESLSTYTTQLKSIENERSKAGIDNSLSGPVARVLKEFNNKN